MNNGQEAAKGKSFLEELQLSDKIALVSGGSRGISYALDLPWEKTDKAEILRKEAGL